MSLCLFSSCRALCVYSKENKGTKKNIEKAEKGKNTRLVNEGCAHASYVCVYVNVLYTSAADSVPNGELLEAGSRSVIPSVHCIVDIKVCY